METGEEYLGEMGERERRNPLAECACVEGRRGRSRAR